MDPSCLSHCVTAREVEEFRERGFLVLPGALGPEQVAPLLAAFARLQARIPPNRTSSYYNYADILALDDCFLDALDVPTVFPKIFGLLGWNIQINHSHMNVDLPAPGESAFGWHRDGAIATWDLATAVPLLGTKVAFYLTDVSREDAANTYVIPGSQNTIERPLPPAGTRPADAVPVVGGPGTVLIMDPRILHCRGPNHSDAPRQVLFLQYGFRWLRPLDAMRVDALRERCSDPIRRQLLGLDVTENAARRLGSWYPQPADVPLRGWLIEHLGARAAQAVGLLTHLPPGWESRQLPTRPSQY